ncbi:MAG TPA: hypothetical protein VMZ25_04080 [Terriglobales bacterium]|nr:hypothetical protein [Terriglobales bacterium]
MSAERAPNQREHSARAKRFCRGALGKTSGKIYEGTSNMQLNTIAKIVLGGK